MLSRRMVYSAVVALIFAVTVSAQEARPTFEVASVKPQSRQPVSLSAVGDMMPRVRPGGVFNPTHTHVGGLVMFAHDLREYRIIGGPEWIWRDLFQIDARAGADAPPAQIRLMVQALLEDRFKLAAHTERREMRVQALVRAQPGGRPGPNLLQLDECSAAVVRDLRRNEPEKYPPPFDGTVSGCNRLSGLAEYLAVKLGTPVIDDTGLSGAYYYTLRAQFPETRPTAGLGARIGPGSDFPSLPTALEQQLGLKLESRRVPMEVLVIDSVQRPTEN